ncbi:hypothetical protein QJQ45_007671 [Haematococcus lacustris]|nr:hypothetical protein QJQ45_007671 [Haematococcus lacustris]
MRNVCPRARVGVASSSPPAARAIRASVVARGGCHARFECTLGLQSLVGSVAPSRPQVLRTRHVAVRASASAATTLPPSLKKIVGAFQMVPDPMARYKQLLFYATKLAKMPAELHVPENKVEGCVSQVWVVPELRDDGKVYWQADSDSQLTKGLAALLVQGLSGCTPQEIMAVQADFIDMLGLKQSLTPSRNNGFLNMLRLMQRKTLQLAAGQATSSPTSSPPPPSVASDNGAATAGPSTASAGEQTAPSPASNSSLTAPAAPEAQQSSSPSSSYTSSASLSSSSNNSPSNGGSDSSSSGSVNGSALLSGEGGSHPGSRTPLQDSMRRKLTASLQPTRLVIEDQSSQHSHHAAMMVAGKAGSTGETHFRVEVVSEAFRGMGLVARQRNIYRLLEEEFQQGLHALSLDTKTPEEAAAASSAR